MRYSQLFGKTTKSTPADAESVNARFLTQGGFVNKQMAGVYNYLPLGLRVLTKIQNIIREEMNALGGQEILMPALTQEESYVTTGRTTMDILFRTEIIGGGKAMLNPTHEEVVTPLVQSYAFSYRDLPIYVYQIQNKFRNEARAKSGILRGREFNMKDMYSFHTTVEDLDTFYDKALRAYFNIYNRLGLGEVTVLTYASGGAFSRYSHEFQSISDIGEDTIYLCEKCRVAVNKEIIEEHNFCPNCNNVDLKIKKAIEVGNIFKLHTKFSDSFKFTFKDAEGNNKPVEMGCYGMGPSRIMGALVEIFHDEKGIIWPEAVAPFKIHLVNLAGSPEVTSEAEKLFATMLQKGFDVLFDDREGVSAGEKFGDADLIGVPTRIIISKKTLALGSVEVKKRNEAKSDIIKLDELVKHLS
ncbi:MAG: aminoacyl--tRNA ligase-related protein [Patescibacteria group bacterium]|jgi:prolyl-tRNA synthetase